MAGVVVGEQPLVRPPRACSRAPRRVGRAARRRAGPDRVPGTSATSARKSRSLVVRSARIASSTPGYCTFTATSRPSCVRARCTWPIDAAAIGVGSHVAKTRAGLVTELVAHDLRDTVPAPSAARPAGATRARPASVRACRRRGSSPSGRASSSAPFMCPSVSTTCAAVRSWYASSSAARASVGVTARRARCTA